MKRLSLALLVLCVVSALAWLPTYWVAISVVPARTPDGHPVMPIAQVAFATLFSVTVGLLAGIGFFRRRGGAPMVREL